MPNRLSLTRKADPDGGPVSVYVIDEELCRLIGKPVSPTYFVESWLDSIGGSLACGKSYPEIRRSIVDGRWGGEKELLLKICDYLAENYTPSSWAEIGRPITKH